MRLENRDLVAYAAPALGFGFMTMLVNTYFMKYATDVLAIPAATMGGILLLSRAWDAVVDPVAGYLSDRTHTRFGRRRPWLLAGPLPLALGFALAWSPPASLSPDALVVWTGGATLLFFTSMTLSRMPHEALGAELSRDYQERNPGRSTSCTAKSPPWSMPRITRRLERSGSGRSSGSVRCSPPSSARSSAG